MIKDINDFWLSQPITPCETINIGGVEVVVKRDDLNHEFVQGNKLRKLKYNLIEAQQKSADTLVTFGGAYSNHLLATAFAAKACGFKSVGVVRGQELADNAAVWSETLFNCQEFGMQLVFVSRSDYRLKANSEPCKKLLESVPNSYLLPEGGSNDLALKGVTELIAELKQQVIYPPTHLFCPVGTGGTFAGLVKGVVEHQWDCQIFGVGVLKGLQGVKNELNQWLKGFETEARFELLENYHAGGYAKKTEELSRFCVTFEQKHQIKLDRIYNSKSFYALAYLIQTGMVSAADRPLIVHTGGLQGGVNK